VSARIFVYRDRDYYTHEYCEWHVAEWNGEIIGRRRTREEAVELLEKRTHETDPARTRHRRKPKPLIAGNQ
jgi:hypothetical protein